MKERLLEDSKTCRCTRSVVHKAKRRNGDHFDSNTEILRVEVKNIMRRTLEAFGVHMTLGRVAIDSLGKIALSNFFPYVGSNIVKNDDLKFSNYVRHTFPS
ncbi:hypothetical protein KIN20_020872 [Parelaphostrongylus tenuis]|uniref:Uncharacterized protein n=1 Tax=Parelaphostrongylus tenuis TaxID=148309 RepID=A0AAD5QTW8_PARTN|nr:hypothetical protein KIN20_020872 [Parelaphostrongylus tenuis]